MNRRHSLPVWRPLRILLGNRLPAQVVIQFTDACNAQCPQCGMRRAARGRRFTLSVDALLRLIDDCAARKVQALSFTGGEPFLYPDLLLALLTYAGERGIPLVRTGTNGFWLRYRRNDTPQRFRDRVAPKIDRLAATPVRNVWISLDSADPATHEEMCRLPGVVEGIARALPLFHERGLYPAVNLGINRWVGGWRPDADIGSLGTAGFYEYFRTSFKDFYRLAIGLGFTMANACYPMGWPDNGTAGYAAWSADRVVRFTVPEKILLFQALDDIVPLFRHQLRIFTPRVALQALIAKYNEGRANAMYPCRGGVDFFFIDARLGRLYPCGYRHEENADGLTGWGEVPSAAQPYCQQCDWECFRDPGELLEPLLPRHWRAHLSKMFTRPDYFRTWLTDLRYYRACNFFNGRVPPNLTRLGRFTATEQMSDIKVPGAKDSAHRERLWSGLNRWDWARIFDR